MTKELKKQLNENIDGFLQDTQDIFEIGELSDLKVQFHFSKSMEPENSVMVIASKTEKWHIENNKVIDALDEIGGESAGN
jgi:hypothetical protein